MVCLSSKPVVDGLERKLQGSALVFRVNIREEAGKEIARIYNVYMTPTYLAFNDIGEEVHRQSGGFPEVGRLEQEVLGNRRPSGTT